MKFFYLVMLFLFSCVYAISHFSQSCLLWTTFVALFCHLCWEESLRTVSSIQEVYRRTIQSHNFISYFTAYPPFHWFQFYFWFAFDHWMCKWSVRNPRSWMFIPDSVHIVVCKVRVDFSLYLHYFAFVHIKFHLHSYWQLHTVKFTADSVNFDFDQAEELCKSTKFKDLPVYPLS